MVKARILKNDNIYTGFIITGHANYDSFGNDIVCAAISTISQATIMGLEKQKEKYTKSYLDSINRLEVITANTKPATQLLFSILEEVLREIEIQYPNNIELLIERTF